MTDVTLDLDKLTQEEEDIILGEMTRRLGRDFFFKSLEGLMTHEDGFGLDTATPLQRAIFRIAGGDPLEELADHPDVIEALGGVKWELDGYHIPEFAVIAAVSVVFP